MLVCSVVVATAALWTTLAPRIGALHAAPAALAFAAAAALCAARRWRAQPRALEIGPDRIRAFDRDGTCVADGSLTGCVQWSTVFLVLTVGVARQRRTLVIAADAVAPEAFRELAVRGRCANGG